MLLEVLKNDSDNPDDGEDEGSEGKGTEVVSEGPPEASGEGEVTSRFIAACEVPCANSDDHDEA